MENLLSTIYSSVVDHNDGAPATTSELPVVSEAFGRFAIKAVFLGAGYVRLGRFVAPLDPVAMLQAPLSESRCRAAAPSTTLPHTHCGRLPARADSRPRIEWAIHRCAEFHIPSPAM
ncbi:hypothetical protein [Nocardia asiatica]|uniref:hypothetical protein n=1 Tax=Nocardia asiatica TaxID=209252 RepID=UPI00245846ED|nr:hypothetical protein [Nocardia asiatica]